MQIDPKEEEDLALANLELVDRRRYGSTLLLVLRTAAKRDSESRTDRSCCPRCQASSGAPGKGLELHIERLALPKNPSRTGWSISRPSSDAHWPFVCGPFVSRK